MPKIAVKPMLGLLAFLDAPVSRIRRLAVIDSPRARVRAGVERPHRRDRSGKIHPRVGAVGFVPWRLRLRTRSRRHGRRDGDRRSHLRRPCGRGTCSSGERYRRRGAAVLRSMARLPRAPRCANCAEGSSIFTGSTSTRRCSTPPRISSPLDPTPRWRPSAICGRPRHSRTLAARAGRELCPPADGGARRGRRGRVPVVPGRRFDRVSPKPGEDEELAVTRQVLANADKLQRLCAEAYDALYEGDQAALPALGNVWKKLGDLAALDGRFDPYLEARASVKSQLEDLAFFLRSYAGAIDASPARLQEVEDRLALLERLKKKHGPSLDEVVRKGAQLRRELHDIDGCDRTRRADASRPRIRWRSKRLSPKLPARFREAAGRTRRGLFAPARDIPWRTSRWTRTRFERRFVAADSEDQWSERGVEQGEFYISPNPGEDLKTLARDRPWRRALAVMLALKTPGRRGTDGLRRRENGLSSMKSMPALAGPSRTSWARGCSALGAPTRCSASRTCRRSPPTARRTTASSRACAEGGRSPTSHASRGRTGKRSSRG